MLSVTGEAPPNPKKQAKRHSATHVSYSGQSEAGRVRTINQDSYFVGELADAYLAVVADGMGGHKTGEVASQKAVEIIQRELSSSQNHPPAALARAVQAANLEIFDQAAEHPEQQGMGTTLTTVYIDDQVGIVGHVGDSRAYLIRDNAIRQLTFDHSWVAERVRQGILTQDEARHHRLRNVITNALGATPAVKLDVLHFEVLVGDKLLLCSDGISMLLSDEQLLAIVQQHTPSEAVSQLLKEANGRGSPDNVTAIVLEIEAVEARPKRYALPETYTTEPQSVNISQTMGGIRQIEETYPRQDLISTIRRQAWYPYRGWILGSLYLVLLIVILTLWR